MNARRIGECKGHRDQAIDSSCHRVRACCACGCRRRCALCKAHSPLEQRTDRRYNSIRRRRRGLLRRLSALSRSGSVGVDLHSEPKPSLALPAKATRCGTVGVSSSEAQCDWLNRVKWRTCFSRSAARSTFSRAFPAVTRARVSPPLLPVATVSVTLTLRSAKGNGRTNRGCTDWHAELVEPLLQVTHTHCRHRVGR